MENLHDIKIRLKNDLPKEGINQVLKTLKGLIPESAPKYNSVIQIESAYKEVKLSIMDGILDEDAIKKSNAEIRGRLLKLIDSLEAADFDKKTKKSTLAKDQEIRKGHVLYKIPQKMQLWQEARCLVRIAFEKAMLIEDLDIDENTQFRMDVRISDYMKVEVFDPGASPVFEIRTTSEPVQIIDQDDYTEWKFYIKPLQAGEHKLELKVTIMLNIDGEIRVREKTLEESVVVMLEEMELSRNVNTEFKSDSETLILASAREIIYPSSSGGGINMSKQYNPPVSSMNRSPIWSSADNLSFSLTKFNKSGEPQEKNDFFNNVVYLNRRNLDPNNRTITSKVQATIEEANGCWYIINNSSLKSTFIQVPDEERMKLTNNQVIILGNVGFIFEEHSSLLGFSLTRLNRNGEPAQEEKNDFFNNVVHLNREKLGGNKTISRVQEKK